MTGNFVAE